MKAPRFIEDVLARVSGTSGPRTLAPVQPRAGYMRDGRGIVMAGWNPHLRDPERDVHQAWNAAAARTIDLTQNVGWFSGGIEQAIANTVGQGLKLNAQPDPAALGLDKEGTRAWAKDVETRFQIWARNKFECDVEGRRNFGQMQAAFMRAYFAFGECVAQYPYRERAGGMYGTKVRLISPHRLSQMTSIMDRLWQGVRMDADGLPVSYVFEFPDPILGKRYVEVKARDEFGRPNVTHVFDGSIGQVRGITPLVPVLAVARQYDQLANATLMSALVQTVFAATLESSAPTEEALQALLTPQEQAKLTSEGKCAIDAWFDMQAGYYENKQINVGLAGRIAHTLPGESLKFNTSQTPNANYQAFARDLLREMARTAGVTYESWTGDYAGVTFSSIRFATDEIFRIVTMRRQNLIAPFCQDAYSAWLEEEIDKGRVPLNGGIDRFLENRAAITNAEWKGSPKPVPDELKAAQAQAVRRNMGVVSDTMIAADNGDDINDVYQERADEAAERKRLDLPDATGQNIVTTGQADQGAPAGEDPNNGGKPNGA